MALPVNHPFHEVVLQSTAASVATGINGYVRAPFRGRIVEAGTMIGGATTTADATCTLSIAGTAVTGGSWVVTQSGSAAGDLDFAATAGTGNNGTSANSTITAANVCNEGDAIKFAFTGSGTGGGHVHCYAVVRPI